MEGIEKLIWSHHLAQSPHFRAGFLSLGTIDTIDISGWIILGGRWLSCVL